MRYSIFAAGAAALLAGCTAAGSDGIDAGEWETTVTFSEIEIGGMPEELAAMMREQLVGNPQTESECIAGEAAADPVNQLLVPDNAGECTFEESVFENGRIAVNGSCPGSEGDEPGDISITGSYTATSIDAEIGIEGSDAAMGDIRMAGSLTAERTGECVANESAEPAPQADS